MKTEEASPDKRPCPCCERSLVRTGSPWDITLCRCGYIGHLKRALIPNVAILICDLIRLIESAGIVSCTKCGQRDTNHVGAVCRECIEDIRKSRE